MDAKVEDLQVKDLQVQVNEMKVQINEIVAIVKKDQVPVNETHRLVQMLHGFLDSQNAHRRWVLWKAGLLGRRTESSLPGAAPYASKVVL